MLLASMAYEETTNDRSFTDTSYDILYDDNNNNTNIYFRNPTVLRGATRGNRSGGACTAAVIDAIYYYYYYYCTRVEAYPVHYTSRKSDGGHLPVGVQLLHV